MNILDAILVQMTIIYLTVNLFSIKCVTRHIKKPMFWCKLPTYSVFNTRGLPGGVCFYTSFF